MVFRPHALNSPRPTCDHVGSHMQSDDAKSVFRIILINAVIRWAVFWSAWFRIVLSLFDSSQFHCTVALSWTDIRDWRCGGMCIFSWYRLYVSVLCQTKSTTQGHKARSFRRTAGLFYFLWNNIVCAHFLLRNNDANVRSPLARIYMHSSFYLQNWLLSYFPII